MKTSVSIVALPAGVDLNLVNSLPLSLSPAGPRAPGQDGCSALETIGWPSCIWNLHSAAAQWKPQVPGQVPFPAAFYCYVVTTAVLMGLHGLIQSVLSRKQVFQRLVMTHCNSTLVKNNINNTNMKQQKQNPKTGVSGTIGAKAPVWLIFKWEMVSSIFFFSIICSFQFF